MSMSDKVYPYWYYRSIRGRHAESDTEDAFDVAQRHGVVAGADRAEFLSVYRKMERGHLADKVFRDNAPLIDKLRPGEHQ